MNILTKNVCELVDFSGNVAAHYDYAPFGAVTAGTPSGSSIPANPFQFSSEFYDSELDLVYYNYRHYSPFLGRWLSRDPIEEQGGVNLYAFCRNMPIVYTDAFGKLLINSGALRFVPKIVTAYGETETAGHVSYGFDGTFRLGSIVLDKTTCCYYVKDVLIEVCVSGTYNDEASRTHEQYHFNTWMNSFYAFELVAKSLLFSNKSCIGNHLSLLFGLYELQGAAENARFDIIPHQNDEYGEKYRAIYQSLSAAIEERRQQIQSDLNCLC